MPAALCQGLPYCARSEPASAAGSAAGQRLARNPRTQLASSPLLPPTIKLGLQQEAPCVAPLHVLCCPGHAVGGGGHLGAHRIAGAQVLGGTAGWVGGGMGAAPEHQVATNPAQRCRVQPSPGGRRALRRHGVNAALARARRVPGRQGPAALTALKRLPSSTISLKMNSMSCSNASSPKNGPSNSHVLKAALCPIQAQPLSRDGSCMRALAQPPAPAPAGSPQPSARPQPAPCRCC